MKVSYLDAENAPDWLRCRFLGVLEECFGFVKVSFHNLDFGGFLFQLLGSAGRTVAGQGEDFKIGVFFEKSIDDATSLLAGSTGDQDWFRHAPLMKYRGITI